MFSALRDLLFPPACLACDARLHAPGPFCGSCEIALEPARPPWCTICGEPFAAVGPSHPCRRCLEHRPAYDLARSAFLYGGPLMDAIHRYKYHGRTEMAGPLGRLLAGALPHLGAEQVDLVIPTPLHPKRLAERGFDQVVPLARAVARASRCPTQMRALRRVHHTAPQVSLRGGARRTHLAGAFRADLGPGVPPRTVLLVDDVLTTGATVSACAGALKRAGVRRVLALTLGRS